MPAGGTSVVRVPRRGQKATQVGSRLAAVAKSSDWGQGSISGPRSHEALGKLITVSEQPFLNHQKVLHRGNVESAMCFGKISQTSPWRAVGGGRAGGRNGEERAELC